MTTASSIYCAVYDFKLLPYALGDVLTWNVQTAVRCAEAGRTTVDVYVCMDPSSPASIYQGGLINDRNCGLFFSELYGAFGTHPKLGNIHIYSDRERLLKDLERIAEGDPVNEEVLHDYRKALAAEGNNDKLIEYFIKYIYSHQHINDFFIRTGDYPRLQPRFGCSPDVDALFEKLFAGRYVVVIHPRMRRLDAGYQGDHTYFRDSDFLEWFEFVRQTARRRPDVLFVVVGRLQEKPVELLRLPNVMSLRALGMGLGHELTTMLRANLFIGTSSGFAAMVNFSHAPYYVTKMNRESYRAYEIEEGADRLPFAAPDQLLTAEPESAEMLARLLDEGLKGQSTQPGSPVARDGEIDPTSFGEDRMRWLGPGATTCRYFTDDLQADQETAFLLAPRVNAAAESAKVGDVETALGLTRRVRSNFPRLLANHRQLAELHDYASSPHNRLTHLKNRLRARVRSLFRTHYSSAMELAPPSILGVDHFPWRDAKSPLTRRVLWCAYLPIRAIVSARRGTLGSDLAFGARKIGRVLTRRSA